MVQVLVNILLRCFELLLNLLPYVVVGVLLAEILRYTSWADFVQKGISKSPAWAVVIAAALGMVSPLCTFGTVPIVISLYRKKVPLAPLITFLSASSLINPQLFAVTWGSFGFEFAIARVISVFVFSVILGVILTVLEKRVKSFEHKEVNEDIKERKSKKKDIKNFKLKIYLKDVWSSFKFIGGYLLLGIAISVTLEAIAPISLVFERATMEWLNIIIAALASIPVYVCGGGVIPLISMLMDNGMSTGAAMAFFIVGPATRITALAALKSFLSKRILVMYVLALLVYSVVLGLVLNIIFV